MSGYIAIDGGTTNTRVSFVKNGEVVGRIKESTGAGDGREKLMRAVADMLNEAERDFGKAEAIIASGMITSKNGLYELPHISAPAGIKDLHAGMKKARIMGFDFTFIPGIKKESKSAENADMMRGEETELAGLAEKPESDCAYILPGSHSKCILTDESGRICDFSTYLTGEMISALIGGTILKESVCYSDTDTEYLAYGFDMCEKLGINEALFKTRILDCVVGCEKPKIFSCFMGVVMHDEIKRIANIGAKKYVVGGKSELRIPETFLLRKLAGDNVFELTDEMCKNASALGAVKIFEYK